MPRKMPRLKSFDEDIQQDSIQHAEDVRAHLSQGGKATSSWEAFTK